MRISTFQFHQRGVDAMLDQQSRLSKTQLQVATGKRILTPSDDPVATRQLSDAKAVLSRTEQYQRNAEFARNRLSLEETTLRQGMDTLQRVRELAVQGLNDTYGDGDRSAIAAEVRELLENMLGLANTRDGNGDYLFGGSRVGDAPFVDNGSGSYSYQGDQGQRLMAISPTRRVAVDDAGDAIFMRFPDGTQDIFTTLYQLAEDLEAGTPSETSLQEIDAAMENLGTVVSRVGARLNAVEEQSAVNDDIILQNEQLRSELEDLDLAEATTRLNLQLIGLQAAQQSYVQVRQLSLFNYL